MAFPNIALKMACGMSIKSLMKQLIKCFKLASTMALNHLGLLKPPDRDDEDNYPGNPSSYVVVTDGPYPSMFTVSADVLTSLIKKRLPVVEYGNLLERFGARTEIEGDHSDSATAKCTVCLEFIEKRQEIRELRNCCHVFHRECLDRWVDQSQITCPLCRSILLPLKGDGIILG